MRTPHAQVLPWLKTHRLRSWSHARLCRGSRSLLVSCSPHIRSVSTASNPQSQPRLFVANTVLPHTWPEGSSDRHRLVDVKASDINQPVLLEWNNGDAPSQLSRWVLRDACPCSMCVDKSSGQKSFHTTDLPADPEILTANVRSDGALSVLWKEPSLGSAVTDSIHQSTYPVDYIRKSLLSRYPLPSSPQIKLWDAATFNQQAISREVTYEEWMKDADCFAQAFSDLLAWGLIVVKNLPDSDESVERVASRIGHLMVTFYGKTWSVESKPEAENVAYTSGDLRLHQDLLYMVDVPRVQLLHCRRNSCVGGDSIFADGVRAAQEVATSRPDCYDSLCLTDITYQYLRGGHYYHNRRPVVPPEDGSSISDIPTRVYWSPPFQGPLSGDSESLRRWKPAADYFNSLIEAPANLIQFQLEPGSCAIFDNTRILHGRTRFDTSSGSRLLTGAYISTQVLQSKFVDMQTRGVLPRPSM